MDYIDNSLLLVAKICGNNKLKKIAYELVENGSLTFLDKNDILLSEIEACEKLLKYTEDQVEREVIDKELSDLG